MLLANLARRNTGGRNILLDLVFLDRKCLLLSSSSSLRSSPMYIDLLNF